MNRVRLTVCAVALVSLLVFIFLGAVSFESATSLSTVNQQSMLRSLLAPIRPSQGRAADWQRKLEARGLIGTGDFLAFVMDPDGGVTFLGVDYPTPNQSALANYVRRHPDLAPHQMSFEVQGSSFVWVGASDPGRDGMLFLAYERLDERLLTRFKFYFVPSIIAVVVVLWISVWSGLIARRALLAHEKQNELELEVVRQEEASRIKSVFLANMSHELRTPLNAIIGFAQIMQLRLHGPVGNAKYSDYLADILAASSHLLKLIANILDISKIEAGEEVLEEETIRLPDVVKECLAMTEMDFKSKRQTVTVDLDDRAPCVLADRLKLRQILLNLLTNANKFTPEGGAITATVAETADGRVRVSVADNGKGIAPNELGAVLHPFKRSQDRAETAKDGFGLGLPLSAALAKLHDATFELKSELGVGTSVSLTFPRDRVAPQERMSTDLS